MKSVWYVWDSILVPGLDEILGAFERNYGSWFNDGNVLTKNFSEFLHKCSNKNVVTYGQHKQDCLYTVAAQL